MESFLTLFWRLQLTRAVSYLLMRCDLRASELFASIVLQCPVFVVDEALAEATVEVLGDHSLYDVGDRAHKFLQSLMESWEFLRNLFALDSIYCLETFVDRRAHNLAGNKQAKVDGLQ